MPTRHQSREYVTMMGDELRCILRSRATGEEVVQIYEGETLFARFYPTQNTDPER
uniref:Uncharacterized protein n=1 Tax=Anguilla anguilla TaxID=7936 RepID=A0A0E9XHU1_ANGAN